MLRSMSRLARLPEVEEAFSRKALRRICEADERSFGAAYDMQVVEIPEQRAPDNFFFYKDNGSNVLAVAHLDTVGHADDRACRFTVTEGGGTVVFSRALDDRLGAYVILELLPKLGLKYDVLLTVGEESGQSTAQFFDPPKGKHYDYMIEFDRGGTDVVMYQYDDAEVRSLVKACGARVGDGSFSDISYLGHLGIKGFNWGVGYRDYHGPRAHAFLDDTFLMVARYLTFAEQNAETYMPHYEPADERDAAGWGRLSWGHQAWLADDAPDPRDVDEYAAWLSDVDRGEGDPADWEKEADFPDDWDHLAADPDAPDWREYPSLVELNEAMGA
jgi:hypothetical protein